MSFGHSKTDINHSKRVNMEKKFFMKSKHGMVGVEKDFAGGEGFLTAIWLIEKI